MVRWSEPHSSWPSLWLQVEKLWTRPFTSPPICFHALWCAHWARAHPVCISFITCLCCHQFHLLRSLSENRKWIPNRKLLALVLPTLTRLSMQKNPQTNQNKTQKKRDFSLFPKITWLQFYILGSLKTASDVSNRLNQRGAVINGSLRWELGEHALHFHSFFSTILSWSHCSRDLDAACYPGR